MRVSRRNAEGYFDPTAYAAMVRVEREARQRKGLSKKKQGAAKRRRNRRWKRRALSKGTHRAAAVDLLATRTGSQARETDQGAVQPAQRT